MNLKQTHWYPGHMHKAVQAIQEKLKWIDLLVVVLDARAIHACLTVPLTSHKSTLYVVNKKDLADDRITQANVQTLKQSGHHVALSAGKQPSSRAQILKALHQLGEPLWQKQVAKGIKRQALKVMITGVPNVGKSTLINLLAKQRKAVTENRPGTTRGQQWIKLDELLLLLDTPGVLPPRFVSQTISTQLALIGSMPLKQMPLKSLASYLYAWLKQSYPNVLTTQDGVMPIDEAAYFNNYGQKRGWMIKGQLDEDRVYQTFIKSFQDGLLGPISLPTITDEKKH